MNKPAPIDTHSVMFITQRPDVVMVEGNGSWLTDNNGKRYLDFLQGWAVNCLGHCNPGMIAALNAQAKKLINPSPAGVLQRAHDCPIRFIDYQQLF
jgi:acetylornithine/N-succinyldiaminopimelate aminotransferase